MAKKTLKLTATVATDTEVGANSVAEGRVQRIREASRRAGGHSTLAAKSGLSLSTLNRYLSGGELKVGSLVAIADASGLSMEWLATGRGEMVAASPELPVPATEAQPLFASLDMSRMAKAIEMAQDAFKKREPSPDYRRQAQVFALIYDFLGTQKPEMVRALIDMGSIEPI